MKKFHFFCQFSSHRILLSLTLATLIGRGLSRRPSLSLRRFIHFPVDESRQAERGAQAAHLSRCRRSAARRSASVGRSDVLQAPAPR